MFIEPPIIKKFVIVESIVLSVIGSPINI